MKTIRKFNIGDHVGGAYYVGAHSAAHAIRLLNEVGFRTNAHHFKGFGSECWGNSMDGTTPEVGVWREKSNQRGKVTKIL